uniref:Transposase n=1 Tax=Panagrellus redivivus TaxID=6233 RepID=A0A7E4VNG7_PANRE
MQHVDDRDVKVSRVNFTETFQRQQTEDFSSRPVSAAPSRWVAFVDELGTPIQQLERSPPPGRSTFIY